MNVKSYISTVDVLYLGAMQFSFYLAHGLMLNFHVWAFLTPEQWKRKLKAKQNRKVYPFDYYTSQLLFKAGLQVHGLRTMVLGSCLYEISL